MSNPSGSGGSYSDEIDTKQLAQDSIYVCDTCSNASGRLSAPSVTADSEGALQVVDRYVIKWLIHQTQGSFNEHKSTVLFYFLVLKVK